MPRPERDPVWVFDLDGTILDLNSFPQWLLFLMAGRIPELGPYRRTRLSLHVTFHLARRKLGGSDHNTLLRAAQGAWNAAMPPGGTLPTNSLQTTLLRHVRPNLRAALAAVTTDRLDAVLATAAVADYATELGRRLGFRHILATPSDRAADEPHNVSHRKCERVCEFVRTQGWQSRPIVLLTDHIDDLPLIRTSDVVCWFGPALEMEAARNAAAETQFVFCRDLTDDGMALAMRALSVTHPAPVNAMIDA